MPQPRRPFLFIHGAGHDHRVWAPLRAALSPLGHPVLTPDLPGHGPHSGPPLSSVERMAEWVVDHARSAGLPGPFILVGHSMGSLVALEAAVQAPAIAAGLILLGTGYPMPVSPALLDAALTDRDQAHQLINQWSFVIPAEGGVDNPRRLELTEANLQVMASQAPGVLHTDLTACNAYAGGLAAAGQVRCPTLVVNGAWDQMTPVRALPPLLEALCQVPGGARMISLPGVGHNLVAEAPDEVYAAIRGFVHDP